MRFLLRLIRSRLRKQVSQALAGMKVRRRKPSFRSLKTYATHGPEAAVVGRPVPSNDEEVRLLHGRMCSSRCGRMLAVHA